MDAYEATKIVFQRIQALDPENASKIMGLLLIQDHGEKEMIRLAFGPETSLHSVILKSKRELGLSSPNTPLTPPSLSRQNSSCSSASSRLFHGGSGFSLPSPLSITNPSLPSSWTNSSTFSDGGYNGNSPSTTMNPLAPPFEVEVDLIDELQLQDQLSFLNDDNRKSSDLFYPHGQELNDAVLWGELPPHRRSCSVSDICDDGGFGWKPCLYYAKGYCKNGNSCRFLHGEGGGPVVADGGAMAEQQCQEYLRSKSTHFPNYSALPTNKCMSFLDNSPRGLRNRLERFDFAMNGLSNINPGSRQIYLTFPADSTFKEEDVSNYFSIFGPVQDVRIPYQQKRMFGFVTFDYPETVKLILAKGNPHFVCDARVLVKPYKEKGKIPEKHRRHQQQIERGEFIGCGSPTGLESRDPYDLQIGARMFYNTQDLLWRRKLEEQADLEQAIELQNRRLIGLQLLDVKRNNHHRTFSTGSVISSPTYSPTFFNQNSFLSGGHSSPEFREGNGLTGTLPNPANAEEVIEKRKDFSDNGNGKQSPPKESAFLESFSEHNLPDSPFASPKASSDYTTPFSNEAEKGNIVISPSNTTNNNLITGSPLFPATSSLDMAPFKSCYFQVPRFSSGHETIG
ncbi:hypothetical protein RD792_004367, partial [Penstemon davidsonii]